MYFSQPAYLLLLLLLPLLLLYNILLRKHKETTLRFFSVARLNSLPQSPRNLLLHLPIFLRLAACALIILVLARPQSNTPMSESEVEGIDIMLAMDISSSMLTNDLRPNRIEAAKELGYDFFANRPHDNIGITLFGGEAFTYCPLTTDHTALLSLYSRISCDLQTAGVLNEGTAIGMGLMNAISHLEKSKTSSKIIILLTDGANNAGNIPPLTAADIAKKKGIRIYTIAVGTQGKMKVQVDTLPDGSPYYVEVPSDMDPTTLQKIAQHTGGLYYAASTNNQLSKIYHDIDKLERSRLKAEHYQLHYEYYFPFALAALLCFCLELLLRLTYLRRIP